MAKTKNHIRFTGRLLMVGFGCIGRAVLPLLLRHTGLKPDRIRIVTDKSTHRDIAEEYRIAIRVEKVTPENYRRILSVLFNYAVSLKACAENPVAAAMKPKVKESVANPLPVAVASAIAQAAAPHPRKGSWTPPRPDALGAT